MIFENRQKAYRMIMLVVLTIFLTFLATTIFLYRYIQVDGNVKYILLPNDSSSIGEELSKFKVIIDQYFLGEVDEQKLKDETIKGYIKGLGDEYSEYITKEEYDDFSKIIMGNYTGIGIYMVNNTETNQIEVIAPMKNSPAADAGILPGDIILKIDGIEFKGEELTKASNKIKGKEGTTVSIEVKRGDEILKFDVLRKKIVLNPIETKVIEKDIGYMQVISFDEECSKEFKQKYEDLKAKGIKSLIIDLRNNGGGIVKEALTIANYIVPKDKTLLITVNKKEKQTIEKAEENAIIDIPVIVLINENSASASEILAGALKDNGYAKLVGTKTYGKGVIQEVLRLTDGSALKLTTEEYYTPNNTKIDKIGIEPDEKVELPEGVEPSFHLDEKDDTQLKKAIEMLK